MLSLCHQILGALSISNHKQSSKRRWANSLPISALWLGLCLGLCLGVTQGADANLPTHYQIVLGSYAQRDIALRELVEFTACKQPLYVREQQIKGVTMWRVVDGPLQHLSEAEIVHQKWLDCGYSDAWINQVKAS